MIKQKIAIFSLLWLCACGSTNNDISCQRNPDLDQLRSAKIGDVIFERTINRKLIDIAKLKEPINLKTESGMEIIDLPPGEIFAKELNSNSMEWYCTLDSRRFCLSESGDNLSNGQKMFKAEFLTTSPVETSTTDTFILTDIRPSQITIDYKRKLNGTQKIHTIRAIPIKNPNASVIFLNGIFAGYSSTGPCEAGGFIHIIDLDAHNIQYSVSL